MRVATVPAAWNPAMWLAPLAPGRIGAMACLDTVLVSGSSTMPLPLLVHELAHVAQFRRLGAFGFLAAYVDGWLAAGCRYHAIPLEREAREAERAWRIGGWTPPLPSGDEP
ncbi:MAG: hypothetical protein NW201_00555 [Gemmatimonadales bacterium]|nr:hypothetical protein [Gemmatimonadales bacterium]